MALFGFNLVLSMIAASVLQKITPRYSVGRYLLGCKRLYRYVHPTNQQLKAVIGIANNATGKGTKKRKQDNKKLDLEDESFQIPRAADLPPLEVAPVSSVDILQLPFYVEYRWLVDFAVCTSFVYFLSEIFVWNFPKTAAADLNLSVIWCLILVAFCMKAMAQIAALYFRDSLNDDRDTRGERNMCLAFGVAFFLATMIVFILSESYLELGILEAYDSFTAGAANYMKTHDIEVKGTRSPVLLYLMMSIFFGFLAGLLTFPCLRYARMYLDALRYASDRVFLRLMLHASFLSPLFALVLWIKPVARDQLVDAKLPLLTSEQFESLRIWCVLLVVLFRLVVFWPCLQGYLNIAYDRVANLKTEAGRINNLELQRMIARIFFYLCIAAVQYLAPVLLLLALTFVFKTCGHYSWLALFGIERPPNDVDSPQSSQLPKEILSITQLFTVTVNRGLWSFTLFWTCFLVFALNSLGVVYYSKFGVL